MTSHEKCTNYAIITPCAWDGEICEFATIHLLNPLKTFFEEKNQNFLIKTHKFFEIIIRFIQIYHIGNFFMLVVIALEYIVVL